MLDIPFQNIIFMFHMFLRSRLLANTGKASAFLEGHSSQGQGSGKGGKNQGKGERADGEKGKGGGRTRRNGRKGDQEGKDPVVEIPKWNKKMSNKITCISGKHTELRCLTTQLNAHTMNLTCASVLFLGVLWDFPSALYISLIQWLGSI